MKYLFIGAVEFSGRCLSAILSTGVDVCAVLCPSESKFNSDFQDLGPIAAAKGVPVRRFKKIADEAQFIRESAPDVIFVLGLSQIIPPEILSIAKVGCIGSHPALLPLNRGRHPIIWALANGLDRSGLSLFWLDAGVDSGDLWKQASFEIKESDDAGSLYGRVCELGEKLLIEGLGDLERGVVTRTPQDHSKANYLRKRGKEDGKIDWRMSSKRIVDLVRALRPPYGGAHSLLDETEFKVWRAHPTHVPPSDQRFEPGRILKAEPSPIVKTGDGAVVLESYDPAIPLREGDYLR